MPFAKLAHSLETWLWRRGFHLPAIRLIMRNILLFLAALLLLGLMSLPFSGKPLTFAVGALIFANVFWGIARHILGIRLAAYGMALLVSMLLQTTLRLVITAVILYVVLVVYNASAIALVGGIIISLAVALGTYARANALGHKQ